MGIVKNLKTMDSNHKKPKHSIVWRDQLEAQDYPAASSDLCLLLHSPSPIEKLLNRLQAETILPFKAKDIFHVARDLGRHQLIIADGDHHFMRCICRMKMPSFLARCFH